MVANSTEISQEGAVRKQPDSYEEDVVITGEWAEQVSRVYSRGFEAGRSSTRSLRRRSNIAITSKGLRSWDCTVESTDFDLAEHMTEMDALVAALEERCKETAS